MTVKSKLIQAIFTGFLSITLLAPSTAALAQNGNQSKVKKQKAPKKQKSVRTDRKSTRLNSSHVKRSRMPSSA